MKRVMTGAVAPLGLLILLLLAGVGVWRLEHPPGLSVAQALSRCAKHPHLTRSVSVHGAYVYVLGSPKAWPPQGEPVGAVCSRADLPLTPAAYERFCMDIYTWNPAARPFEAGATTGREVFVEGTLMCGYALGREYAQIGSAQRLVVLTPVRLILGL